jgi:hypothetical protein
LRIAWPEQFPFRTGNQFIIGKFILMGECH